ncbi:SEC-C metal-binding domain-containing protein [Pyxidicoccus xibeiensis]|uniref:SEC-C metal-binding domain-containing protein n=1 Tax=Pyxidicoccus xibeiensis TaxID=2906759 RepID=UPI0020A7B181|nr:SEC-C metal-binding domain-containing protein [Pyxidicoccus xibeiensis]MCP3140163.1 SEC-C domain-containing protein [Pyxidicoccus xibeiensis]
MSQKKPGRNDPCPCGSGKKYKACHAAEDRARATPPAAPAAHPLTQDLKRSMEVLGDPDVSRLSGALERLRALLTEWGPAPGLRFEAKAFVEHVGPALAKLSDDEAQAQDAASARRELLVGTVRKLGTPEFLAKLGATLLERAGQPGRSAEDRQALAVGALLASAAKKVGAARPEDIPVLDVVFDVQFREWSAKHKELAKKYEALEAGLAEETLPPEARDALKAAREGDVEALLRYVQSDPGLAERIAREARERAARVEARMREPGAPPVFAPEEELWLTIALWEPMQALKSLGSDADPAARREAVTGLMRAVKGSLEPEFLSGLLNRLREKAKDASADEATRAAFMDTAIAFEAEPARMTLAALLTARQEAVGRSAEEMVMLADLKALTAWTPEAFEPYRALLVSMGLPESAKRIERAQEWLREHPVTLRPETEP